MSEYQNEKINQYNLKANPMRFLSQIVIVLTIFIFGFNSVSLAADTSVLEQRLNDLEQQVAVLKRQIELEKEDRAKKATESPVITANAKDGFSIKSTDDSFKLRVRGLVQADARYITDNKKDLGYTDTHTVRRARPIFEGTVGKNFDFLLVSDFGSGSSVLVDAYTDFKLNPGLKIRGGRFKVPLALERLQSDAVGNFTELGLTGNLTPNRDVGFQLHGDVFNNTVNYAIGVFNGGLDASNTDTDNNNDKDIIARIFTEPFKIGDSVLKGLGLGVGASFGHKEGGTLPTYRSSAQGAMFTYSAGVPDGDSIRIAPQAYYYNGSLGLIGEYVSSQQELARTSGANIIRDSFNHKAWQITGNYVLTGELASYKGFNPRTNFDLEKGTWGAFEVVSRFGRLDIDESVFDSGYASLASSVSRATAIGVGLNWYPHKNVKLALDFENTSFERGAASNEHRKDENAILSRFQLTY